MFSCRTFLPRRIPRHMHSLAFLALSALALVSISACSGNSTGTPTNNHPSRASGSVYYFALQPAAAMCSSFTPICAVVARDASTGAQLWSDPVTAGTGTFVASSSEVVVDAGDIQAFRASDGKLVWSIPAISTPANSRLVPLAITDNAVFVSEAPSFPANDGPVGTGAIEALNPANGTQEWRTAISGKAFDAALAGRTLYMEAATLFGPSVSMFNLVALDAATGKVLWQVALGYVENDYYGAPTVSNGALNVLEVQVNAGTPMYTVVIHAFRASDGSALWTHSFVGDTGAVAATAGVVVAGAGVYPEEGSPCPTSTAPGGSSTGATSCAPPTILTALSATDGSQLWSMRLVNEKLGASLIPLLATSSHLYLALTNASGGSIEIDSLDIADGKSVWSHAFPEGESFVLQLSGSALYFAASADVPAQGSPPPPPSMVGALNATDGSLLWERSVGEAQVYPMVVVPAT